MRNCSLWEGPTMENPCRTFCHGRGPTGSGEDVKSPSPAEEAAAEFVMD